MTEPLRFREWHDTENLRATIAELRTRLADTEETLRAISAGEVDALVVHGPDGESVFSLAGAERPYRVLIETLPEGALTLTPNGDILYCNGAFARMVGVPLQHVLGRPLAEFVPAGSREALRVALARALDVSVRVETVL
ncbi:MAG: PAS domain-containing protein, partial [Myxococcota bacterium]